MEPNYSVTFLNSTIFKSDTTLPSFFYSSFHYSRVYYTILLLKSKQADTTTCVDLYSTYSTILYAVLTRFLLYRSERLLGFKSNWLLTGVINNWWSSRSYFMNTTSPGLTLKDFKMPGGRIILFIESTFAMASIKTLTPPQLLV